MGLEPAPRRHAVQGGRAIRRVAHRDEQRVEAPAAGGEGELRIVPAHDVHHAARVAHREQPARAADQPAAGLVALREGERRRQVERRRVEPAVPVPEPRTSAR